MRVIAAVAVAAVVGFADRASAQYVVGTGGTYGSGLGYYSPAPGVMYSPFRPAPVAPYGNSTVYPLPLNSYPVISGNGTVYTRVNPYVAPHYGGYGLNTNYPYYRGYRRW